MFKKNGPMKRRGNMQSSFCRFANYAYVLYYNQNPQRGRQQ
jgi:hypothetical protein